MQGQDRRLEFVHRCSARPATLMAAALLVLAPAASAQIFGLGQKPKVPVTINHPADLGITLAGKKVAFQVTGACAQQLADLVKQDFARHGVTVVDRADLGSILAEHHLQASTSVDPTTAVELGKVSGASIMVVVEVSRCATGQDPVIQDNQYVPPVNISRTEAHFMASIRTVDLATGRELAISPIQKDLQKDNTAQAPAVSVYPGTFEVQDEAVKAAANVAHNLYFPWAETREVSFMNNKECNLKQAYDLLKTGDLAGTLKLSQENVELCKSDSKPAHQADALYNLGVVYMLSRDYENALATLTQSQRVHADRATVDAISECREAQRSAAAMKAALDRQKDQQKAEEDKAKAASDKVAEETLTNDKVIQFVKNGMSEDLVVKAIASSPAKFSLRAGDLIALKQAGVPDKVIAAMLDKK